MKIEQYHDHFWGNICLHSRLGGDILRTHIDYLRGECSENRVFCTAIRRPLVNG